MCKTLITGFQGMLGTTLTKYLQSRHYEVIATDIGNLDVRNSQLVNSVIREVKPDIVFHLAAITDLELCEERPELAIDVNTYGTQNIVKACNAVGSKVVYISTGAVFDGTKRRAYTVTDEPNPQSVYGKTKYWGEQAVVNGSKNYLIVRSGWLFGGFNKDKKFVAKILNLLLTGCKEISAVNDTYGSSTFTDDFVVTLELLVLSNAIGLYHVANQGFSTRYEIVEQIIKATGMSDVKLKPVSSEYFKQKYLVPRIANETLDTSKTKFKIRVWQDALTEYVCKYIGVMKHAITREA